jgi:hypothetical protein
MHMGENDSMQQTTGEEDERKKKKYWEGIKEVERNT